LLILTRKIDESILIGDDIVITLKDIDGRSARIGISAPPNVAVDREEIRELKIRNPDGKK